ncbi:MAG: phosphoribosylformimino-5-aminoimidazole carboxamide ribotide isomerase [Actinomycetota bacterium]|jgi:phosphoribosylformimino-5-aminoimidazole carboxamide ribotide isomerase|nr:phosphoribosylformimino-5-aminoimidazole carboxamide ribotide isomerase [Actinomycetota bacterium]
MLTRENGTTRSLDVVPAVDVLGGRAVRLRRGDFRSPSLDAGDPLALIARYAAAGASLIHLVDLEGARDGRFDADLVAVACRAAGSARVQMAGGIRSVRDARLAMKAGAARVVVGTAAFDETGLPEFVAALGESLVVAIDVKGGQVVAEGWLRGTGLRPEEAVGICDAAGVGRILCTAVERDGMRAGPDIGLLDTMVRASCIPVLASGGVGSLGDIERLGSIGVAECVVGRAFIDGSLPLALVGAPADGTMPGG